MLTTTELQWWQQHYLSSLHVVVAAVVRLQVQALAEGWAVAYLVEWGRERSEQGESPGHQAGDPQGTCTVGMCSC